jgi:hypothetical protein
MAKEKPSMITEDEDGNIVLNIGSSDDNADWLKLVDDGKRKEGDLDAHDDARRLHDKDVFNA